MRFLRNLSIRGKAFAAWLVLFLCLVAIGGNAYLTSDRAATDLDALTSANLPKQQVVAKLDSDISAIHLNVFRYVSWASNSVSAALLNAMSAETREGLAITKKRIGAIAQRQDLSPANVE